MAGSCRLGQSHIGLYSEQSQWTQTEMCTEVEHQQETSHLALPLLTDCWLYLYDQVLIMSSKKICKNYLLSRLQLMKWSTLSLVSERLTRENTHFTWKSGQLLDNYDMHPIIGKITHLRKWPTLFAQYKIFHVQISDGDIFHWTRVTTGVMYLQVWLLGAHSHSPLDHHSWHHVLWCCTHSLSWSQSVYVVWHWH